MTNSLGILSEALHSGIDLIAAGTTYVAVKKSDKPPDPVHLYGHYKVENLSSLIETILLYLTCAWVIYEAITRLFFKDVEVNVGIYALLVMVLSIVIDFSRSRALYRVAKKYKSQALEADAIHFSTDLLSSAVVIIGIIPTMLGFKYFDAIAGLGVSAIIFVIGYRIGKKSINALLDAAPEGTSARIREIAASIEGVLKVGQIRVRESGPKNFIDITVYIDKVTRLEIAHRVTEELSNKIESEMPGSDIVVHAEPLCLETTTLVERIRAEASNYFEIKNIHNIRISEVSKRLVVDFHLELEGELSLTSAHDLATSLESKVRQLDPCISEVYSHFEPLDNGTFNSTLASEDKEITSEIEEIIRSFPDVKSFSNLELKKFNGKYAVNVCCRFDKILTVQESHDIATKLEETIRANCSKVDSVSIHQEPAP